MEDFDPPRYEKNRALVAAAILAGIAKAMAGQWSEALHAPTLFSTADGSSCP